MPANDRLSRIATLIALALLMSVFASAACDGPKSTRKDDAPRAEARTATDDGGGAEDATEEVGGAGEGVDQIFEDKQPESVGPDGPAVFMLSSLKGYTEPCGCTLDVMLGGIDRIVGYVDNARPLYPDHVVVDGGDLFFEHAELKDHEIPQEKARVDVIVAGVKALQTRVTVPGELDFALGADFYRKKLAASGAMAIGANVAISGEDLPASKTVDLNGTKVIFVGIADPDLYGDVEDVAVGDPHAALNEALAKTSEEDTIVAIAHGELAFARELLEKHDKLDFVQVGHAPRETDQVYEIAGGFTLEPYDQGRYLGILKLLPESGDGGYVNAREGSEAELKKVERQIEHINKSIGRMPPASPGEEPPILLRLRKRLGKLEERRREIKNAGVDVPNSESAFIWRTVALEPGYPTDQKIEAVREEYNANLRELNMKVERDVPPVEEGEPFYIGTQACAQCHAEAHAFWKKTNHATALATLEERNKAFDQSCIGCHVVGYEKPGGSVLGKLRYDVEMKLSEESDPITIHKDLRNVGCENCHGPGSAHRRAPVGGDGKPQNIESGAGEQVCSECHVSEHSPRFNYDVYVEQITGEGHLLGND